MQLTFKCSGLKKPSGDFDPMIVIFRCKDKKFKEVHQKEEFKTEAVLDDTDPKFVTKYTFDFKFEEMVYFQARIYNERARNEAINQQKYYGQVNFVL